MNHIGSAMRFVRQSLHLSMDEVASKAGVSVPTISRIEIGTRDPSWKTLQAISNAMGVDVTLLTMLVEAQTEMVKPMIPVVYAKLWERSRANGALERG